MTAAKVDATPDDALFHLLVDSVQDYAIFALDPSGRVASWNRGAAAIKRYPAAEILGHHFSVFYPAEDRAAGRPAAILERAAAEGRALDEGWRVRSDGSRFWAAVVVTALRGADGALVGFAKVTRDLTEQRAAAEALRERERQLTETQRLAGLGSWHWDAAADRVTWTEELYRIYGLDPERSPATFAGYLERVHPGDRERVRGEIERALAGGADAEFEFEERILRPGGEVRVLRSRGRALLDAEGRVRGLTGACLDVTALKESEARALDLAREQAARAAAEATAGGLRFLLDSSEALASSLDHEATLRTVATRAVPAVADWCAVDLVEPGGVLRRVAVAHPDPARVRLAEEFVERYPPRRDAPSGPWHVIDSGEPEYLPEITDEMIEAGAESPEQLAILRELGLRSAITVPLAGRGGVLGVLTLVQAESGRRLSPHEVAIARELGRHAALAIENARLHRDVERQNLELESQTVELEVQTEELQVQTQHLEELLSELGEAAEALRARTLEAEEANRAKAEFLAAMSHELRTPLNAIFGYADLLELGVYGPVTEAQRQSLERIKRNQRTLLSLVNDVLNFARVEAGKLELHPRDLPVAELVGGLEALVAPQLEERGLRYRCSPGRAGLAVRADAERAEQVLLNLLTNSIKFTGPGGEVEVRVEEEEGRVRIHVADTGCGIAPEKLATVFDPFVQLARIPGTPGASGVGLGLAISRELAAAMGGTLSATSEAGVGSTFTLDLPRGGEAER